MGGGRPQGGLVPPLWVCVLREEDVGAEKGSEILNPKWGVARGPPTNPGGGARGTGGRKGGSKTSVPSQQNFLLSITSNPFEQFFKVFFFSFFSFWRNAQFPSGFARPLFQHCAQAPGAAGVAAPSAGRFLNCGMRSRLGPASFQKCPMPRKEKHISITCGTTRVTNKPMTDVHTH